MEEEYFNELRTKFTNKESFIEIGKMMSSEAITYKGKVFAFFSRKKKMVFKLGKDFNPNEIDTKIQVFNPFKKRGPLNGWFEIPFSKKELWKPFTEKALNIIKQDL